MKGTAARSGEALCGGVCRWSFPPPGWPMTLSVVDTRCPVHGDDVPSRGVRLRLERDAATRIAS